MKRILNEIAMCIVEMDEIRIEECVKEAIEENIPVEDIYMNGLNEGMKRVVQLYEEGKYYVPETIVCADTLYKGINVLKQSTTVEIKKKGKVLIAVVKGDTHDIGKNIVAIMLEAAGYEVIDLGYNVELDFIIEKAIEEKVDIIALSSMMTTTMKGMKPLIKKIKNRKLEKRPLVIIGGAPVSKRYADEINADGYSENAPEAVSLVNKLLSEVM
ncbi:cobalamin B12-binding domain-containing protein [Oceanirhabdus seepicola]|uniref:Cobalamin-dependent protein n=1 Tax=Oceanirhabdus seepicola TaxID=2828781 RepID=A0A9J6P3K5_9CLOT|nr:cobalamin-dependent protein [Oceanirhabdus seepicola]MCM1991247.1 cobalamin-dependent protein [Oceanirhabdus seepicola]